MSQSGFDIDEALSRNYEALREYVGKLLNDDEPIDDFCGAVLERIRSSDADSHVADSKLIDLLHQEAWALRVEQLKARFEHSLDSYVEEFKLSRNETEQLKQNVWTRIAGRNPLDWFAEALGRPVEIPNDDPTPQAESEGVD